jgi:hypothetical protein
MRPINRILQLSILITVILAIGFIDFGRNTIEYSKIESLNSKNNGINELITERKKSAANFKIYELFRQNDKIISTKVNESVKKADFFDIDKISLSELYKSANKDITLKINSKQNGSFELELTRYEIIPDDFTIKVINGSNITYEKLKHRPLTYRGIIKGKENSLVSITVTNEHIMGVISDERGDFNLGPKKDVNNSLTDEYIFYNDLDLTIPNNSRCDLDNYMSINDKMFSMARKERKTNQNLTSGATTDPIRVYFVADYRMYLDNGSNVNQTVTFVVNMFNNVSVIYQADQIPTVLSGTMTVYTSTDPYASFNNSFLILNLFGNNTRDNFNGDLAHLLSTGHNQQLGGIAWINILCQPYVYFQNEDVHYGRYAFSNIENSFNPYPIYSWTVEVVTHEMGHNIASKHTHACVWPTNSGQIDSCVSIQDESCVPVTVQNNNGTIMSYCHLNGAINLANRFGPLPTDTLKLGYRLAACLDSTINSSEVPLASMLMQNYPNPFNPETNIKFALANEGYVTIKIYDVTGKEIAILINNKYYDIGIYSIKFDAKDINLSSGVYLYKLDLTQNNKNIYSEIKKMVLIK